VSRQVIIHLDQFAWVRCARAHLGRTGGEVDLPFRDELLERVEDGSYLLPLSESHYFETWRQGGRDRRGELSAEMAMLSRFVALCPFRQVLAPEFDHAVITKFGPRVEPRELKILGWGAAHALGFESFEPPAGLTAEQRFLAEWLILGNLDDADRFSDYERERHEAESEFAVRETSNSIAARRWTAPDQEKTQRFRVQALSDFNRDLTSALMRAGVTLEEVGQLDGEDLAAFVSLAPCVDALTELRRLRYRNPAQGFRSTDLNDLRSLAVAVVYCDVVVADKAWHHVLTRSDLPARHGTRVVRSLAEAVEAARDVGEPGDLPDLVERRPAKPNPPPRA
jgi:hypothetical protein